jgi:ketosteroid isomerase-like protein
MAEETVRLETARRLYERYWVPGELEHVDEVLDPTVVWTAIESAPDAGTRRGHDECRAYMQEWLDDFALEPPKIEAVGATPAGELVCSLAGFATGRASGVRTEIRFAITFGFAGDGRIASIHEYATLPEANRAAGLAE